MYIYETVLDGAYSSIYFRIIEYLREDGKWAFAFLSFKNVLTKAKRLFLFFFLLSSPVSMGNTKWSASLFSEKYHSLDC